MAASLANLVLPSVDVDHAENPHRLIRAGLLAVVVLVLAVTAWVMSAPLSGAAIAPGFVKVEGRGTCQRDSGARWHQGKSRRHSAGA